MDNTETRFDTVHETTLKRWYGFTIKELMEEKYKIQHKLELLTNESHGIRNELNRVLRHLENYIDRRVDEEADQKE